jgi:hypothetical protein
MIKNIERFKAVLERLASPAEQQKLYLENLKVAPSVDELALEFDDALLEFRPKLTLSQINLVDQIDNLLNQMSNGPKELWHVNALSDNPSWQDIRVKAKHALDLFETN